MQPAPDACTITPPKGQPAIRSESEQTSPGVVHPPLGKIKWRLPHPRHFAVPHPNRHPDIFACDPGNLPHLLEEEGRLRYRISLGGEAGELVWSQTLSSGDKL